MMAELSVPEHCLSFYFVCVEPPFKTLITLLPVTFSQLDPQLGVVWGKKVNTVTGYLLTDGLNCLTQIFSQLAFGIKGCSSKTRFQYI